MAAMDTTQPETLLDKLEAADPADAADIADELADRLAGELEEAIGGSTETAGPGAPAGPDSEPLPGPLPA